MKPSKTFTINIRHYASISFGAHFTSAWEQIVTSIVMLMLLGAFTYPLYIDDGGVIFWILLSAIFIILLSLLFDLYFVIIKLLRKPKKQ